MFVIKLSGNKTDFINIAHYDIKNATCFNYYDFFTLR